jgi:hypothetical protein
MIRLALLALILPFATLADDPDLGTPLIDFYNGNQIHGSTFLVGELNDVVHTERVCCPPRTDAVEELPLSDDEMVQLATLIAEAGQVDNIVVDGGPAAMGAQVGELKVAGPGEGGAEHREIFTLFKVEMTEISPNARQKVTCNPSPAAKRLLDWVNARVRTTMTASCQ